MAKQNVDCLLGTSSEQTKNAKRTGITGDNFPHFPQAATRHSRRQRRLKGRLRNAQTGLRDWGLCHQQAAPVYTGALLAITLPLPFREHSRWLSFSQYLLSKFTRFAVIGLLKSSIKICLALISNNFSDIFNCQRFVFK